MRQVRGQRSAANLEHALRLLVRDAVDAVLRGALQSLLLRTTECEKQQAREQGGLTLVSHSTCSVLSMSYLNGGCWFARALSAQQERALAPRLSPSQSARVSACRAKAALFKSVQAIATKTFCDSSRPKGASSSHAKSAAHWMQCAALRGVAATVHSGTCKASNARSKARVRAAPSRWAGTARPCTPGTT